MWVNICARTWMRVVFVCTSVLFWFCLPTRWLFVFYWVFYDEHRATCVRLFRQNIGFVRSNIIDTGYIFFLGPGESIFLFFL